MAPVRQLLSMNDSTDVCSSFVCETAFRLAYGEITRNGSRWLGPHRSAYPPAGFVAFLAAAVVQTAWSVAGSADPLRIFGATWSYQPSVSSYVTTIAVLFQSL